MPTLVKVIRNIHLVEFDRGRFDHWCVYLKRDNRNRYAPRDSEYFLILQQLAAKHGHQKMYDDFVIICETVNTQILPKTLDLITQISETYFGDAIEIDIWFTVLYAGMIAEENKENMVLRKRIKRLGMYQVLIEKMQPDMAAKFSFGKKYAELNALMKERGF